MQCRRIVSDFASSVSIFVCYKRMDWIYKRNLTEVSLQGHLDPLVTLSLGLNVEGTLSAVSLVVISRASNLFHTENYTALIPYAH